MNKKIEIGSIVYVNGQPAKVLHIETHDGELDYLVKPMFKGVDFCKSCGGECGGSNWFRRNEFYV